MTSRPNGGHVAVVIRCCKLLISVRENKATTTPSMIGKARGRESSMPEVQQLRYRPAHCPGAHLQDLRRRGFAWLIPPALHNRQRDAFEIVHCPGRQRHPVASQGVRVNENSHLLFPRFHVSNIVPAKFGIRRWRQ